MTVRMQKVIQRVSMVLDGVLVYIAYFIAINLRFEVLDGYMSLELKSQSYQLAMVIYCIMIVLMLYYAKLYAFHFHRQRSGVLLKICCINGIGILMMIAVLYLFRIIDFSRMMLFMFWAISCMAVFCRHEAVMLVMRYRMNNEKNHIHVIVIGNGHLAHQYIEDVAEHPELGIRVDGYVSAVERPELGVCLGSYEALDEILDQHPEDELIIALEPHETCHMVRILSIAEKEGTRLSMISFYNDAIPASSTISTIGRTRLIDMRSVALDHVGNAMMKRIMDIAISSAGLVLISPMMLITAIGVKLSSEGPVIFKQQRIGKNRKPFTMYKFRSMAVNGTEDCGWSTGEDPRRTGFGRLIRKYSIDELPQLVNVLKGDMSLVGPRPEIPFHVDHFKEEISRYLLRQQVKPGMTGWAQVHGLRGDTSIEARVSYDLWYIENWSLLLDVKILFMTLFGGMINREEE